MFDLPSDVRREIWSKARFLSAKDQFEMAWTRRPEVDRYWRFDPLDCAVCFLIAPQKLLVIVEVFNNTWEKRNGSWHRDPTQQAEYETSVHVQLHEGLKTHFHIWGETVTLMYSSTLRRGWTSGYRTEYGDFRQSDPFWTYWSSSIPEYMLKCLRGDLPSIQMRVAG